MKKKLINKLAKRLDWLLDNEVEEKDVMWDESAEEEYIMADPPLMDEGENESGKMVKVYLPNFDLASDDPALKKSIKLPKGVKPNETY